MIRKCRRGYWSGSAEKGKSGLGRGAMSQGDSSDGGQSVWCLSGDESPNVLEKGSEHTCWECLEGVSKR